MNTNAVYKAWKTICKQICKKCILLLQETQNYNIFSTFIRIQNRLEDKYCQVNKDRNLSAFRQLRVFPGNISYKRQSIATNEDEWPDRRGPGNLGGIWTPNRNGRNVVFCRFFLNNNWMSSYRQSTPESSVIHWLRLLYSTDFRTYLIKGFWQSPFLSSMVQLQ